MDNLAILSLCSAGVTVLSVGACFVLGLRATDAERRAGEASKREQELAGKLAIAASDVLAHKSRGDSEKRRADALYDVLSKLPRTDARAFVLSLASGDHPDAASSDSAGAVHSDPAAKAPRPSDTELIKPE